MPISFFFPIADRGILRERKRRLNEKKIKVGCYGWKVKGLSVVTINGYTTAEESKKRKDRKDPFIESLTLTGVMETLWNDVEVPKGVE